MPIYKRSMVILLLLLAVAAGGALYGYSTSDEAIQLEAKEHIQTESNNFEENADTITVYVCGAVVNPMLVTVKAGARAAEAIEQCGGVLPTADMNAVNMAQVLKDGMQLKIPEKNTIVANGQSANGGTVQNSSGGNLVNINQADAKGLEALPGIGPAMAQRIVEYREANGSFSAVEDLQKVKGIGKAKFEKLKDKATV